LDLNPLGQVPCLQFDDGRAIPESLIVCEYLDSAYPENRLTPSDPYTKAQHQLLVEAFSKVITIFYKVYRGDSTAAPSLMDALEGFEKKLESKYFGGERIACFSYIYFKDIRI
jgi:glutathione S-transferase